MMHFIYLHFIYCFTDHFWIILISFVILYYGLYIHTLVSG